MPQLSLYLDDEAMASLRMQAGAAGLSLSKFAAAAIAGSSNAGTWPHDYWQLFGCIADDSFERPRQPDVAADRPRPSFDE